MDVILNWVQHNPQFIEDYREYTTHDFFEIKPISDDILNALTHMMVDAKNDPEILSDVARIIGWEKVAEYVKRRSPKKDKIKKGDFGEALINYILSNHFNYDIPVRKLRYKLSSDQSLPATDSLALKIVDEKIIEICYVESKTPTVYTTSVMKNAYEQLQNDYDKVIPDIIMFTLEIIKKSEPELYNILKKYLGERSIQKDKDRFVIGYTCEKTAWSFTSMKNLKDVIDDDYPPAILNLVRIKNLEKLIHYVINLMGDELID